MNAPRRTVVLAALAVLAACRGGLAAHPDAPRVASAQRAWCAALARFDAPQDQAWAHTAACNAAAPTGSASFIAKMTDCYVKHHEEFGENASDLGTVLRHCIDQVQGGAEAGDVSLTEPVQARCARMERCEKVPFQDCLKGVASLDTMQRASLTSVFNLRAQHAIAECLEDAACTRDEDVVRERCYRAAQESRVWLPRM